MKDFLKVHLTLCIVHHKYICTYSRMLNPIFNDGRWETCREEQKIEEGQYIIPSLSQQHNFKLSFGLARNERKTWPLLWGQLWGSSMGTTMGPHYGDRYEAHYVAH